jgi:tetratricopeptide (TPR) repeat protein
MSLSRRADRKKAVFSVVGLSQGGGKGGANAYRALNIRRELLVDHQLRAIFWLTGAEARELSRHAPDFWAFRHRVVEFNRPADINRIALTGTGRPLTALRARRKQARLFPEEAREWLELGQLCLRVGLLQPARQAFLRGLALEPNNTAGWLGLAKVHRLGRNVSDAIINYRQVLSLEPQNIPARIALIACYRGSGQMDLADEQMEAARRLVEHGNEYEQAALASVCGNAARAIKFLRLALDKQQTSLTEIRFDPDMDYLRSVPEFMQLLSSPSFGEAGGVKE